MPYDNTKHYPEIIKRIKYKYEEQFPVRELHIQLLDLAKLAKEKTRNEHINNMQLLGYIKKINKLVYSFGERGE